MTTTDDPERFRKAWDNHVEELEAVKQTLHPDKWDELDEHTDAIRDLIDHAADNWEDEE